MKNESTPERQHQAGEAKMRQHVINLCSAIHQYRFAGDNYGPDDIRTGRARDLMQRAQAAAQEDLDPMSNLIASVATPDPFEPRGFSRDA